VDVARERARISAAAEQERVQLGGRIDAEHQRQRAQFENKLAARKKLLAQKQEAQLEREVRSLARAFI
jgi:uncharacterized membrane protein YcjF (UPF0283 family)